MFAGFKGVGENGVNREFTVPIDLRLISEAFWSFGGDTSSS